jgi:ribosomal RNA-processing protein 8
MAMEKNPKSLDINSTKKQRLKSLLSRTKQNKIGKNINKSTKSFTKSHASIDSESNDKTGKAIEIQPVKKDYSQGKLTKLQLKFQNQLKGSKFRWINETLYTKPSTDAYKIFKSNPELFRIYHDGFSSQVEKWPLNPIDIIINSLSCLSKMVIADMGCGDAKLQQTLTNHTVFSFDLVKGNDFIIPCDIANVPLSNSICDFVVFCLSLMGTNQLEFIKEANRVLKPCGILKIAEVESRLSTNQFEMKIQELGFKLLSKQSIKMFVFFEFEKVLDFNDKLGGNLEILKPCLYKRR